MIYRGQSLLGLMVSLSLSAFLLLVILQFYNYTQRQNQHILQQSAKIYGAQDFALFRIRLYRTIGPYLNKMLMAPL